MNTVASSPERVLLSLTHVELTGICNALNEVCHGVAIEDAEFGTRLGVSRSFLIDLLNHLSTSMDNPEVASDTRMDVWADGASVQLICVTSHGDPFDASVDEARAFAAKIQCAATTAEIAS